MEGNLTRQDQQDIFARVTRLEKDKAALLTEFNLFSTILDSIDALVVMLDNQGRIVRFNQTFEKYFSPLGEKLVAKFIWDLPQYVAVGAPLRTSVRNINDYLSNAQKETLIFTHSGDQRVIYWSNKAFMDSEDQMRFVVSTGSDITERIELEKLLEREQMLLHSLIDSIPDSVFYKDTNGRYLGCNRAFEQLNGQVASDIIGSTDGDLYPPELANTFIRTDRKVLASHQTIRYENRMQKLSNQQLVLETRKSPYYGPDGEILGIIGVSRDITRQKEDEEALRKANSEIESLISSLSSILIVLSPGGDIIRWNPSAQQVLEVPSEAAVGRFIGDIDISWNWEMLEAGIMACKDQNHPVRLDPLRFKRKNGSEGLLGFGISPIYDKAQALTGYILLGSDITERKSLENQLAQAQKLKSIGQLAAGIAHEINTPIQYIGDNVHFLQDSWNDLFRLIELCDGIIAAACQDRLTQDMVAEITTATQSLDIEYLRNEIPTAIQQSLDGIARVTEIVKAMKDFSHPGVIEKVPLDLNKAVENTITVSRNEWKYVADIETQLDPNVPQVICHPGEINQVFLNIIVNAAQAIDEMVKEKRYEKGRIIIRTSHRNGWVEIRITDTGNGIPDHVKAHLYEPFYTTKEVGKGTGQGLAIAYNVVVVKHGGTISCESREGKGTTFRIQLPVQPLEAGLAYPGAAQMEPLQPDGVFYQTAQVA